MNETTLIPAGIAVCPECGSGLELYSAGLACRSVLAGGVHRLDPADWLQVEENVYRWEELLRSMASV